MPHLPFRFANECYTWFMKNSGRAHAGRLGHMIRVTADAGFAGIEPIWGWMGELADPSRLRDALDQAGIALTAIALGLPWNDEQETDEERAKADACIDLLARFPGAMLCTVQLPTNRDNLAERRLRLARHVNSVSRRATDRGIACSYHPNSPPHSTNRTAEDYAVILNALDPEVTGWTPDVGHIINGGMDPLETMKHWQHLINLVHYKDWDGQPEWAMMGRGAVDLLGITRWLKSWGYNGWVVCEDEAEQAVDDPDGVTMHDGRWVCETLVPAVG